MAVGGRGRRPLLLLLLLLAVALALAARARAQLSPGFYSASCPTVHGVVRQVMSQAVMNDTRAGAAVLRLFYHDCFVGGCDASVLLDDTPAAPGEKGVGPNAVGSTTVFDLVDTIKAQVEAVCPATVSCADVLALMARDAVVLANGPSWPVSLGRRDGRLSIANDTNQLPPPTANFTQLSQMFAAKGLDAKDLVVLSGGHTLGTAHCALFSDRLYNFTGLVNDGDVDPALDAAYMAKLKAKCRSLSDNTTLSEMDPGSFLTFDASYYRLVAKRRGIFHSDSALLTDPVTRAYVERQATGHFADDFFRDFADSMVKMSTIDVLTGAQGEIRNKCYAINI